MIETTLGQLVLAEPALERLGAKLFPPRMGYTLAKLRAAVQTETAHFMKMREELAREHGDIRDALPDERATLGPRVISHSAGPLRGVSVARASRAIPVRSPSPWIHRCCDDHRGE